MRETMRVPENNLGLLKVTKRLIAVAAWACLVFIVFDFVAHLPTTVFDSDRAELRCHV